jgi:choline dehydrogenase-like flavoprotein
MSEQRSFDYVVIGAGSSGCVLANRMSEDPNTSVLLLEAGGPDRSPFIHIPPGTLRSFVDPKLNWKFETTPQQHLGGRKIYIPRGKTLGGTSSINAMVYIRGNRSDYDDWRDAGNLGWGWDDVLPYFKKSENNENYTDDPAHGTGGPLNVQYNKKVNRVCDTLFEAVEALQYKRIRDFNGPDQEGWSIPQTTIKKGRRNSTAVAFLNPARDRKNLTIETRTPVSRIVVENGRATSVVYKRNGTETTVTAKCEVLLSAGTIVSPKILMLSGICDGARLTAHGVTPLHQLPGVGANLQDHPSALISYRCKSMVPYGFSIPNIPKLAWDAATYLVNRTGFFSSNFLEVGGFIKTDPTSARPDIFYAFIPGLRQPPKVIAYGHGYAMGAVLMRPKSRGEIRLASSNPDDYPVIDPQFFTSGDDLEILFKGLKEGRRILSSQPFDKYGGHEFLPGPDVRTDDELRDYILNNSQTVYHPVGTCKMGPDDDAMAVVDNRLRVRGIRGLRVIDCSIIPTLIGGNTNSPAIMIAEKAADMIKQDTRS